MLALLAETEQQCSENTCNLVCAASGIKLPLHTEEHVRPQHLDEQEAARFTLFIAQRQHARPVQLITAVARRKLRDGDKMPYD